MNKKRRNIRKIIFIGRKRRRDNGFPYTTQIFDPAVIHDEVTEFDTVFSDNVSPLLRIDNVDESHYGSVELKKKVLAKLRTSKQQIQRIMRRR